MTKFPEAAIDELYQLSLSEFTAARNALAKTLKGADAKRIKQLPKPAIVPWTVNQLFWHARKLYDRVIVSGQALRDAQIAALKGRGGDVRQATDAHRKAVAEAVREGVSLAAKQGANPPADQLARMLEALSLARESTEPPGRLAALIQPSGFEALAGITPAGAPHPPSSRDADRPSSRPGPRLVTTAPIVPKPDPADARRRAAQERKRAAEDRQREKERAAARAKAEAAVRTAERELSDARAALHRAERVADDARHAVQEAERKLATARDSPVLSSPHV